jgi:tRNA(Leu) C34 or U34 (ribose-2'-O)-methylase TrmL
VSAIDRVDAFLQSARVEIRSERERAEAALWRDAMRGGHDAREKVTGVVGDDAAASDDAAESQKNTKGSASDFLQKKVVGGETRSSSPSPSNAPSGFFPVPSALGRHARDGDDTVSVPNDERETFGGETENPDEKAGLDSTRDESPGLVVVASLVEKIPNLAGLARTCEVLGAERLVLADLGVTKHKDFTSVSVTAEKWLRLDECPIFGLKEYLSRLKREGYALVGLEQTRGAEDVEAHAWHRKTALVLGREREGVDADILGMLDACVVIRQRGMIRSLNVHVSASMAVSRYAAAAALHGWQ